MACTAYKINDYGDYDYSDNRPCVLPFIYEGDTYNGCLSYDPAGDMGTVLWCPFESPFSESSWNYGHCNEDCPEHRDGAGVEAKCHFMGADCMAVY